MLGYHDESCVKYIIEKRIELLYPITNQKKFDIYVEGSKYKGVKKEWQPYLFNLELYSDSNIALPSVHDCILLSGMYKYLTPDMQAKVEIIVSRLFDEGYGGLKMFIFMH